MEINVDRFSRGGFEMIRSATMNNNFVWLEAFGCKIQRYEDLAYVNHPQLRDYSAWLILGQPETALKRLEFVLDNIKSNATAADIYLEEALFLSLDTALRESRFAPNSLNVTLANLLNASKVPTSLTLRQADLGNFDRWLALYAEGFSRFGRDAEIDCSRWYRAFTVSGVRHWFLLRGKDPVGICQTCTDSGIVGIYSFTLRPAIRGARNMLAAVRALQAKAIEEEGTCIYFERLFPANSRANRRVSQRSLAIIPVRRMLGYRRQ
jgi:hypothetical protein